MDPSESETKTYQQNVLVMRHGDRLDNFDPTWEKTSDRPWDPPLVDNGLARAFRTGRAFRTLLPFPIHRVFVSPSSAASRPLRKSSPPFVPSMTILMSSHHATSFPSTRPKSSFDTEWHTRSDGGISLQEAPQWGEAAIAVRRRYEKQLRHWRINTHQKTCY
ncbi:hypothetical protein F3Y22_tig00110621pilonHSYRG00388 [Hibiscus syriacus]|uniref:Phosphoglycerate mutase family protein n=1 Tax=Hibiscus syriacus TaxID=106335 RepID=A0A6A2ZZP9_HIBSY|nr:hypothetical protein F3Y22_tig00110621pilonHSYRG00388 [Hibiscus syriacus]